MRRLLLSVTLYGSMVLAAGAWASPDERSSRAFQETPRSGGDATTTRANASAFATPVPKLQAQQRRTFAIGDHLFNTNWTIAPSSVPTKDGLGPLFNRVGCASCHVRDGRGRPPIEEEDFLQSMLIRLSIPGPAGTLLPHPGYGLQLQEFGIPGVKAEGKTVITWEDVSGLYDDGTPYTLRKPSYTFNNLAYGAFNDNVQISARVAPAVFGGGLLEAIPEKAILANIDEDDADGDGISGRANRVPDKQTGKAVLGRFGWKASQPSLRQQSASAFNGDIGLTTSLFPDANCTSVQEDCIRESKHGDQPEISDKQLEQVTQYLQMLAVPQRRNMDDPAVQQGKKLFHKIGCASCHMPSFTTGDSPLPQLAEQTIHPYTDLLLHDMGEGLADNRPDVLADGREWRTPPLWGIGLQETVNQHTLFLHDGRARNLTEAVLWHGGEAENAASAFKGLNADERAALVAFLESL